MIRTDDNVDLNDNINNDTSIIGNVTGSNANSKVKWNSKTYSLLKFIGNTVVNIKFI